ncbi:hypothetical protein [Pedobacter sp. BS3]|uniref:hypothetical protein n=1 Tax=Pedobacter sp. BS3 TaxID=2567937 RepID=UPI0016597073|nr:hypothetical protein [Pedobacter sp. BS3]
MYRLIEDIYSVFHKVRPYGLRGEMVTEIADHGHVLIVENKKGNRFPVLKTKLIEK